MTRLVIKDFKDFQQFLNDYSLTNSIANQDLVSLLKSFHKGYFAFLNLILELDHRNIWPEEVANRFKESCSDMRQSLFLMCHGTYKPANLILRSSIENFVKAIGFFVDPDISKVKKIYEVFEIASGFNGCLISDFESKFQEIHSDYGKLCDYTHTATKKEMSHISALNVLPHYNLEKTKELCDIARRILKNYVLILIWSFREDFFKITADGRENITHILSPSLIRKIHEGC